MNDLPLWASVVGSHAWGMQRPGSDADIVVVTVASTRDVFVGKRSESKFSEKMPVHDFEKRACSFASIGIDPVDVDVTTWEIGNLVNQLKRGNVNSLWTVFSPNRAAIHPLGKVALERVASIVSSHPVPRQTWHSVKGMAITMVSSIEKHPDTAAKKAGMARRMLVQFEKMLGTIRATGKVTLDFLPVNTAWTADDIIACIDRIDMIMESFPVPDSVKELSDALDDPLYDLRVDVFYHDEIRLHGI